MRNKDLMEQNFSLFEQLQKAQHDIKELKKELEKCQKDIDALNNKLEERKVAIAAQDTENEISEEKTADDEINEEDIAQDSAQENPASFEAPPIALGVNINKPDAEYGSEVIGKIVVKSSQYAADNAQAANLIFGKTEMAKAEIMSIISSEISLQQKKDEIDIVFAQAEEYFKGVASQ